MKATLLGSLIWLVIFELTGSVYGRDYYVAPTGKDSAAGTRFAPFKTIQKAADKARAGDRVIISAGIYRETVRPKNSGKKDAPITFMAVPGQNVVISGADEVKGWKAIGNGVYAAPIPWEFKPNDLVLANGELLVEARWPNGGENWLFQPVRATASSGSETTLVCPQLEGEKDAWNGAELWCAGGAAWICWSGKVTAFDPQSKTLTFDTTQKMNKWYIPRKGNLFVLRGLRRCLDAPGEWWYDQKGKRLLLIPPKGIDRKTLQIETTRRPHTFDLKGRSHITLRGLQFRAGGIEMNDSSSHNTLTNLYGRYMTVLVKGRHHLVLSCDLGYTKGPMLRIHGEDNRVINNHIHHGGYGGGWQGILHLSGRRTLFSHNTVRHGGRDLINTHGLKESLVQYNDVSDSGWLTKDLGMFYGHNNDYMNTVFRYNLVHDNHAKHVAMGIYFDHLSHNAIVHHNIVWNVGMDPIRFNNPSYGNLVYHNSCWKTGRVGTFDHAKRNDLFACRYVNNIFNKDLRLANATVEGNLLDANPPYRDPEARDFRLNPGLSTNAGAIPSGGSMWKAGCDLSNPPKPLPVWQAARVPWMNGIRNACFELGSLESWTTTKGADVELIKGNGWGNSWGPEYKHKTGTSKFELQLAQGGVEQTVALAPNREYTLSAWLRVSDAKESVSIGIRGHGGKPMSVSSSSTEWERKTLTFKTGANAERAIVAITKTSGGKGHVWGDNIVLPLTPGS